MGGAKWWCQAAGWMGGLAMLAWGLERLTPLTGFWQVAGGVALMSVGGLRPLIVLITEGVVPLSEEE